MWRQTLLISAILGTVHISVVQCCNGGSSAVLRARANMLASVPGGTPSASIGVLNFEQRGRELMITGTLGGLAPGFHGIHIHENGNLGNGCLAAGDHYNPFGMNHGAPTDRVRHVGDLGNILSASNGFTPVNITDTGMSLTGPQSIVGRAVVIHADRDDLGLGGSPLSLTTGNSGGRVACGIVEMV